jgi:hypothetical protein
MDCDLADRSLWISQAGKSALDTTAQWVDWTGATVTVSPYDGFAHATKYVKQLGLSFGSAIAYASGVAADTTPPPAHFHLSSYTIN